MAKINLKNTILLTSIFTLVAAFGGRAFPQQSGGQNTDIDSLRRTIPLLQDDSLELSVCLTEYMDIIAANEDSINAKTNKMNNIKMWFRENRSNNDTENKSVADSVFTKYTNMAQEHDSLARENHVFRQKVRNTKRDLDSTIATLQYNRDIILWNDEQTKKR
ncbi:hypothetical protein LJC18_05250 [Lachnospiraceae bacterium OttesenSCG-928-E19]|nr:hypothetical protein [Lachnospiraceae bacterium OttesenSCG-928-E19]